MRIANCTTAAQYFHLLRRQAALLLTDPLPLIVLTPKSLLRHPLVASTPRELAEGRFQSVLDDEEARAAGRRHPAGPALHRQGLRRSGRLSDRRAAARDVAIVPRRAALSGPREGAARGARRLRLRRRHRLGPGRAGEHGRVGLHPPAPGRGRRAAAPVRAIARPRSASPAEGSAARHARQQQLLIEAAFAPSRGAGARSRARSRRRSSGAGSEARLDALRYGS